MSDLPHEVYEADPDGEPEQTANAGPEGDGGPEGDVEDYLEDDA